MDDEAKVFGDGDITICINSQTAAMRVYAGTKQIGMIQKVHMDADVNVPAPRLEVVFPISADKDSSMKIEENVRALRQIAPWIKVVH